MSKLMVDNLTKLFGENIEDALHLLEEDKNREEIQQMTGATLGVGPVSLEADPGDIVVIMGLSGSGKSTLIRAINRLIEPTSGTVLFDGQDVTAMSRKELRAWRRTNTGMVFQHFALFPHRTVIENAAYGLEIRGVSREERTRAAHEILEQMGLAGWDDRYPSSLSGGMQQRVGLARALAVKPEIILMDEALSALDPLIRQDMQRELLDLQKELQKIILFISHDLNEAMALGDRIILLKDGRVVQEGSPEDLVVRPANDYVAGFVERVDKADVLHAKTIMDEVPTARSREAAMARQEQEPGIVAVVDEQGRPSALVSEKGDSEAPADNPVRTIDGNTIIGEVRDLFAERLEPIAVVDERGRLTGVVTVESLLGVLARGGGRARVPS